MPMEFYVIGTAAAIATYTDINSREISNWLTGTVLILGLAYTFYLCTPGFKNIPLTWPGIVLFAKMTWLWLGITVKVAIFSLIMFILGVFAGGDGKFLIAISPWAGPYMSNIILYLFPAMVILVAVYLIYQYNFNVVSFLKDQVHDTFVFLCHIHVVLENIRKMEEEVLITGIPYRTRQLSKPPGMVAISTAILLGFFI